MARLLAPEQPEPPPEGTDGAPAPSPPSPTAASIDNAKKLRKALYFACKGHLSKACASLTQSPLVSPAHAYVRRELQRLHPLKPVPNPRPIPDDLAPFATPASAIKDVLKHVPRARAAGLWGLSFENHQAIFEAGGQEYISTVISGINSGLCDPAVYAMLGESRVVALAKPDKGIRPIAIGDSLARLAGKCICRALNPTFARYFTTTAATADTPAPLQLGVGIKGGTEILVHTARLLPSRGQSNVGLLQQRSVNVVHERPASEDESAPHSELHQFQPLQRTCEKSAHV